MVIGIGKNKGQGKSLSANMIQFILNCSDPHKASYYNFKNGILNDPFKIKSFANPLRDVLYVLTGISRKDLRSSHIKISSVKDLTGIDLSYPGNPDPTFRDLHTFAGTDLFRDQWNPNIWINSLFKDYSPKYSNWIIDDVRFKNEAEKIKFHNGFLIKIYGRQKKTDDHKSEDPQSIPENLWDYSIKNDGSRLELFQKLKHLINQEIIGKWIFQ